MLQVGITGGIGSGKSTVSKVFEVLGIPVLDADSVAKHLMQYDPDLRQSLMALFGEETYTNGQLNREHIAALVFNNPQQLEQLNAIVHPATIAFSKNWAQQQTAPYIIKEAALLFESGSYKELDKIIGVYAPLPLRLQRAVNRDQVSEAAIRSRMARQMDEEEKMKRCDFIIKNDESTSVLLQVLSLHEQLLQMAQQ